MPAFDFAVVYLRPLKFEERFAEILNELQARGDKTKLMQLFGA
jgi:hypothetical protein